MKRLIDGVASLLVLTGALVATPVVLLRWGRFPLPQALTSWTLPDTGGVFLGALTVSGWAAWLAILLATVAELLRLLSGGRVRWKVFGATQAVIGALLTAVAAMMAGPLGAPGAQQVPLHTPSDDPPARASAASRQISNDDAPSLTETGSALATTVVVKVRRRQRPLGSRVRAGPAKRMGAPVSRTSPTAASMPVVRHPYLRLIGPIELIGARGEAPVRGLRQCEEYCAWLLEHPGATPAQMSRSLVVAEGTRRANVSRLRTWLGTDDAGVPYLPEAYSGVLQMSSLVRSDWQMLREVTDQGLHNQDTDALIQALRLVRGTPLQTAAPGQWSWARALRTDITSRVREVALVLATRALDEGDTEMARWARARALLVNPGDAALLDQITTLVRDAT